MKKLALLSVLALTASLSAEDDLAAAAQKMNDKSQQQQKMHDKNQQQINDNNMMQVVTLTSARPESDNGWYLFADALYWHVDIGSTDWANVNDVSTPTTTQAHNHSLKFKWDWGFKVGVGVNMDHDMWDSNLCYTWLFADNSNNAGKGANTVVIDQLGIGSEAVILTSGSIKWDLHFSMFDWELGRWYYTSKNLALRPHVGVKGGWIDQKVKAEFSAPVNPNTAPTGLVVHEHFKNNYWGVGPSVGLNTMFVLGSAGKEMEHRFSLFGDFGGALMYGHFDIDDKQQIADNNNVPQIGLHQKGLDRNLATTMLQGMLGLSWDTGFNHGKNHFMFKIGYELQYWFRQNQLVSVFSNGNIFSNLRISDDLALQGVTGEFRFDF